MCGGFQGTFGATVSGGKRAEGVPAERGGEGGEACGGGRVMGRQRLVSGWPCSSAWEEGAREGLGEGKGRVPSGGGGQGGKGRKGGWLHGMSISRRVEEGVYRGSARGNQRGMPEPKGDATIITTLK